MASEESPAISIHVQASTGKKVSIDVTGPQTIAELKAKFAQEHEVAVCMLCATGATHEASSESILRRCHALWGVLMAMTATGPVL